MEDIEIMDCTQDNTFRNEIQIEERLEKSETIGDPN